MSEVAKKKTAPRKTAAKKKIILIVESLAVSTHHDVELLAYQLWEDGGSQHGSHAENSLRAEQQLKG